MGRGSLVGTLLLTLLAAAALPAQRRQPLVGSVVDGDGKPVAAAEVTLIEDDADLVGLDPIDVCRVVTDERGRFVASALVGVRYLALATTQERDGAAVVAQPVPDNSCGQIASLKIDLPAHRRHIAMPLAAELRALPGVHVRMAFHGAAGHHVVLPIGERGIEVPPLGRVAAFTLHAGDGAFLGTVGVPTEGDEALLPSSYRLPIRVVDETGAPVAGARVTVHDLSTRDAHMGRTVTTDQQGRGSVLWGGWRDPFEAPPETLFVTATADGRPEGASGWLCKEPFVGHRIEKRHRGQTLVVPLATRSASPRGQVDSRFAGQRARIDTVEHVQLEPGAHYFLSRHHDVVLGPDGSYELPQLSLAASKVRLQLPPLAGRRVLTLPTHAPTLPSAAKDDLEVVVGTVIDQGGGPATGAKVLLACHAAGLDLQTLAPDAAGRFEIELQHGRWTILAMDDTGWASRELDGPAAGPVELRLQPKPHRRVRVEDRSGRPVAGASFEPGEFRYGLPRPAGLDALLVELGWNTFASHVRRVRTDAAGEATLHFLPWPGVSPTAFAFAGDHRRRSDDIVVEAADEVQVFRLR